MNHLQTALNGLAVFAMVVVLGWTCLFGSAGAVLARARGGIVIQGFLLGALLGPIGWGITYWTTRSRPAPAYASGSEPTLSPMPPPTVGPSTRISDLPSIRRNDP